MTPQTLDLGTMVAGDTWDGIPSITITINGAAPSSALASVRMRLVRVEKTPPPAIELTSAGGKITISNAASWIFAVPPQIVSGLIAGTWRWNMETTAADGKIKTYLQGSLEVLEYT